MKKCVIISCRTLENEVMHILRETECDYSVYFLPLGLHSDPKKLREYIQYLIDSFGNVDRVLLCVSGCGGGTKGLRATTADLVIPKTADCIDILLSSKDINGPKRDPKGVFMTKSWIDASRNTVLDFEFMVRTRGKAQAVAAARRLYNGFEHFYIVDTGTYDVGAVRQYLEPLMEAIHGTVDIIPGEQRVLWDLLCGNWKHSFRIVPKGQVSE